MDIPKQGLYDRTAQFLKERYPGNDLPLLLSLIRKIIFNRPEKDCIRRCPASDWKGLPYGKSLFHSDGKSGLPIGNLTSQLLALLYLDELDHLVTETWGIRYYGRYVDDMLLVHPSEKQLLEVREKIRDWLSLHGLVLHPRKMYLQHYKKGVSFVGGIVRPGRTYISNRTVGYFYDTLARYNRLSKEPGYVETHGEAFVASVNSYLGQMRHFATYNIRKKILLGGGIHPRWWKAILVSGHLEKVVLKKRYKPLVRRQRVVQQEIRLIKQERKTTEQIVMGGVFWGLKYICSCCILIGEFFCERYIQVRFCNFFTNFIFTWNCFYI